MTEPVPIILDCDAGVDDAIALALAALDPTSSLQAVSVVGGNVPVSEGVHNMRTILELTETSSVSVLSGVDRGARLAGGESESVRTPSADAETFATLRDIVLGFDGRCVLVATGPLTNVAILLRAFPQLEAALKEIVFLGGAFRHSGNITPVAEHNIFADPEAADAVFQSSAHVKIIPLNVSEQLSIGADVLEALSGGSLLNQYLSVMLGPLLAYYKVVFGGSAFPIHDPLAVALALHPELFSLQRMAVAVELNGTMTRGTTIIDQRPEAELDNLESHIEIVDSADLQAVRGLLAKAIGFPGVPG
jgi:purine nucleosidase